MHASLISYTIFTFIQVVGQTPTIPQIEHYSMVRKSAIRIEQESYRFNKNKKAADCIPVMVSVHEHLLEKSPPPNRIDAHALLPAG